MPSTYIGRFAPSPTGPMHFGTLIAAVASYLQSKTNQGLWLVRMEDIDTLRNIEGADKQILESLEAFGFEWHGEVVYQSQRTHLYADALESLKHKHKLFPCTCSRKQLASLPNYQQSGIYPGTCREKTFPFEEEHSIRLTVENHDIQFNDTVMGKHHEDLSDDCGDFVIKRRDGIFAYQLVVVVDDALQGITEVVRGADLLDSTARQIYLQQLLAYITPSYMHLPLALGETGDKLSKLTEAAEVDNKHPEPALVNALNHLGQNPPESLKNHSLDDIWTWAIQHWNISQIPKTNRQL